MDERIRLAVTLRPIDVCMTAGSSRAAEAGSVANQFIDRASAQANFSNP